MTAKYEKGLQKLPIIYKKGKKCLIFKNVCKGKPPAKKVKER